MNKIIKIAVALLVSFLVLAGISIFFVSKEISPEKIRTLVTQGISKAFPSSTVHLKKVDYSVGFSISVVLEEFDLRLKKNKMKLFNVQEVNVNIPLWAIITGGGNMEISVNDPNAFYTSVSKNKTNWDLLLSDLKPSAVKEKTEEESDIQIPAFLENSRINIRVTGLNLDYKPYKSKTSKININKILLKNINLKTSTAFEVSSSLKYFLDKERSFSTKLQVIGEVNVGKFLKEKSLKTTVLTNLVESKLTGLEFDIPDLENKLQLEIRPDGVISTISNLKVGNIVDASISATLNKNLLNVSKLETQVMLENLTSFVPPELKQMLSMLSLDKRILEIKGTTKLNIDKMKLTPNLTISMNKPIDVKLENGITANVDLDISLKGKKVKVKIVNETFNGSVTTKIQTSIDPMKLPSDLSKYPLTSVSIFASNMKISKKFIQNLLYGASGDKKEETAEKLKKVAPTAVKLPPVKVQIEGRNIFIADQELKINSKINVAGNKVTGPSTKIYYGQGRTDIEFKTILKNSATINNDFKVRLTNMKLQGLSSFLPPFISGVKGTFNGNISGKLNMYPEKMSYTISSDLNAINGDLDKIDVKALAGKFFSKYKDKVPKDYENVSNRFDTLRVNSVATTKLITLKSFKMVGYKKSLETILSGHVSMIDKKSSLEGTITSPSIRRDLKKEVGLEKFPVRFAGNGFVLIPDIGYTTKKLAGAKLRAETNKQKAILKSNAKKEELRAKKKLQENAKKEEKKVKKKLENKAKELFKGIKF